MLGMGAAWISKKFYITDVSNFVLFLTMNPKFIDSARTEKRHRGLHGILYTRLQREPIAGFPALSNS